MQDPGKMAGPQPLALQLEQLLNPRPREADPEADPEEGEAGLGHGHVRIAGSGLVRPDSARVGWAGGACGFSFRQPRRDASPGVRARVRAGRGADRTQDLALGWAEHDPGPRREPVLGVEPVPGVPRVRLEISFQDRVSFRVPCV